MTEMSSRTGKPPGRLVGQKIRQLRRQRRLTQSQLADRLGVQQSDLSRMERGKYRVSLDTLFKVLSEFEISVSEFFEDEPPTADGLPHRQLRLLREFSALDEGSQREVEDFVQFKRQQQVLNGADDLDAF